MLCPSEVLVADSLLSSATSNYSKKLGSFFLSSIHSVVKFFFIALPCRNIYITVDLLISPSPLMQMSQWQLSTRTENQTSLGFSTIEEIRSSHRFDGFYAAKMVKRCAWGTCNTDFRYPERMGNGIYFI